MTENLTTNTLDLKNIISEINEERIPELRSLLDEFYPQDIAEQYQKLEKDEARILFDILSYTQAANVITELEDHYIEEAFDDLSDDYIVKVANEMDLDDVADIIGLLDDTRMGNVLEKIQRPYKVKELLSYETDSCGGKMNPHFLSVRKDLRIGAALRYVRIKARESQNQIFYIYVTASNGELVGVISLRELFLASDNDMVADHMETDIISVKTDDDQELASELSSKYHFLAIPVVNDDKQMMGIITIDDIVEVIEEEATEDIYQASGISAEAAEDISQESIFNSYKARTPWLIITLFGQFFAAIVIAKFENTIAAIPIAISFMPLLSGMSGNIGNQSVTIVVRGIYRGDIDVADAFKVINHELLTSIGIGLTCAAITGGISYYIYHNQLLAILIGLSLIISMALAVGLGAITPLAFKKLDIDVAAASGPLITTLIDMLSFFVYLTLITKFVKSLI